MNYIAIFFTNSGTIKFSNFLSSRSIQNETLPVPRRLSTSCGIGVRFKYDGKLEDLICEEINKIYMIDGKEYKLVYECE